MDMAAQTACRGDPGALSELLRFLHFRAEAVDPTDGETCCRARWIQLQLFLEGASVQDESVGAHTSSLVRRCEAKLDELRTAPCVLGSEKALLERLKASRGVARGLHLDVHQSWDIPRIPKGRPQGQETRPGGPPKGNGSASAAQVPCKRDHAGWPRPAGGLSVPLSIAGGPQPSWGRAPAGGAAGAPDHQQPPPKDPPRSRWAKPAVAAPREPAQGHAEEEEKEEEPVARGPGGFSSARDVLTADLRKKGQSLPSLSNNGPVPRMGLSRGGRRGPGGMSGGYVPPFVRKAVDTSGGQQGGQGRVGGKAGGGGTPGQSQGSQDEGGILSASTMELLAGPDGELPEQLAKLDQNLVELVCNEVMHSGGLVQWEDIAGQQQAKQLVQEMVVWPMLNPHIFTGARAPPKGLLLFGPPGTGKTLIGKAIASNISATFFNISASSLTSKWIGQGEKMVRTLFAVASHLQPSVIFIDEIDSLLSMRKSEGEHESSRRLKTEMLVQMEGCDPTSADRRVLLVGATNRPEELDEAARRRMPKQLYIPLPCADARMQMVTRVLGDGGSVRAALSDQDLQKIAQKTSGYSGSDMRNLIQEACQGPVRDAISGGRHDLANLLEADLRPVNLKDFAVAARAQRRTVNDEEVGRYEAYNDSHGAKLVSEADSQGDIMLEDDW